MRAKALCQGNQTGVGTLDSVQGTAAQPACAVGSVRVDSAQVERIANPDKRAECSIVGTDNEIIANPYLLSEMDQGDGAVDLIALETIDRGMRPEGAAARFIDKQNVCAQDDPRRIRGAAVAVLQSAAQSGDTLLPFAETINRIIKRFPDRRACRPDRDLVLGQASFYQEALDFRVDGDLPTMGLKWLSELEQEVSNRLPRRTKAKNPPPKAEWSWESLLLDEFGKKPGSKLPPEVEERARKEKAEALAKLYEGRFSVLCGRAGTGKTSVLRSSSKVLKTSKGSERSYSWPRPARLVSV